MGHLTENSESAPRDPAFEIDWEHNDKENPANWPLWYKCFIVWSVSLTTTCVILYSTSYTSGSPGIQESFDVTSRIVVLLGLTTYMIGLGLGCLVLAPLSEVYGRRIIYISTGVLFTILVLPVALAPNFEAVVISRFFGGFFGSASVVAGPGTINDIIHPEYRALAFSLWSLGAMNGPVLGPIIGGFVYQYLGWRWINWIVLICGGASTACLCLVKETYAPVLLKRRRKAKQIQTGDTRWWTKYDSQAEESIWRRLQTSLSRPLIMAMFEPICLFWNVYVGVVYAVLFLCFVGYPIVFQQLREWSPGLAGLGYLGIGTGIALAVFSEPLVRKFLIAKHPPDPITGKIPPEALVRPICIGGILIPIGEFWFSWTARPPVHWISCILAGVPFGLGNGLVFIYATSYLAASYGMYAASAIAGNSIVRYVFGGVLPLAGSKMYGVMGVNWAGTMLALVEVLLTFIPFVFYRYGARIRQRSQMASKML
ncbi:major facilitator superfamily domain-containing protein [Aspergillus pseudocaelatus]|uniref:Major facilitator superfamily domain-containing protein n=1 Tax=Aspergillus pseudocaelatus TaxID=1825620 RepID=A0ABQ6WQ96_9EURO|nr:major facilitator superfamily domain-containing protein [Aspergillus pseudocaelatus]